MRSEHPRALAVAALYAIALAGCAAPRAVQRESAPDARLETQVKIALVAEKTLDAAAIFVDASAGTVRLSGYTDSAERRDRASQVAQGVTGVKSVRNDIALR